MKNTRILETAANIVDTARQSEYGNPVENKVRQAIVASVTLGKPITPEEIVLIELCQKQVRAGRGQKEDTTIDLAGYAEILQRVRDAMNNGTAQIMARSLLPWAFPVGQEYPERRFAGRDIQHPTDNGELSRGPQPARVSDRTG
jgi:hypothetical protein